jgi:hypothetical protein
MISDGTTMFATAVSISASPRPGDGSFPLAHVVFRLDLHLPAGRVLVPDRTEFCAEVVVGRANVDVAGHRTAAAAASTTRRGR